jgi:hypothetical protein
MQRLDRPVVQIYKEFNDEDATWVKTTEFKGGAPGGPPLATNHDVKAVEYLIKYKLSQMASVPGFEGLTTVSLVTRRSCASTK